jgi:hypothetical protein
MITWQVIIWRPSKGVSHETIEMMGEIQSRHGVKDKRPVSAGIHTRDVQLEATYFADCVVATLTYSWIFRKLNKNFHL